MDKSTARQIVLISMFLTGGVIMYDILRNRGSLGEGQSFRAVWSMSLLFLLLSIMADTVPGVAGPFSALVTLSVLIGRKGALSSIVGVGKPGSTNPNHSSNAPSQPSRPNHPGTNP
jgi:hypothetical protein